MQTVCYATVGGLIQFVDSNHPLPVTGGAGLPPSTGQQTAANSTSVVYASDGSAVPVSASTKSDPYNDAVSQLPVGYYSSATKAANTGGTTTTVDTLPAISGATSGGLVPAAGLIADPKVAVLTISNPSGSGQNITAASLTFSDTIGGVASTLTYLVNEISATNALAAGSNITVVVPLFQGVLLTPKVVLTFASAPSASTITVLLELQNGPAPAGTPFNLASSAASTNQTLVKGGAGVLKSLIAFGYKTSGSVYLKLFDKTTAPVTGTDTPKITLAVGGTISNSQGGVILPVGDGIRFRNGIGYAITGLVADNDNTNVASGDAGLTGTYW